MWEEFGRLLKQNRKELMLTQAQLRDRLRKQGYDIKSKSTISKWEHGLQKPNPEIVEALEDVLFGRKTGRLLGATRYKIDMEPDQKTIVDLVDTQLEKKAHFEQLADIARTLLANNLDTLTPNEPSEVQKSDPRWIEYFQHFKYKVEDGDSIIQITQQQLASTMEQNLETIRLRYGQMALDRFLAHLVAEYPELESEGFNSLVEENPYSLIDILRMLAQRKTKGT